MNGVSNGERSRKGRMYFRSLGWSNTAVRAMAIESPRNPGGVREKRAANFSEIPENNLDFAASAVDAEEEEADDCDDDDGDVDECDDEDGGRSFSMLR